MATITKEDFHHWTDTKGYSIAIIKEQRMKNSIAIDEAFEKIEKAGLLEELQLLVEKAKSIALIEQSYNDGP